MGTPFVLGRPTPRRSSAAPPSQRKSRSGGYGGPPACTPTTLLSAETFPAASIARTATNTWPGPRPGGSVNDCGDPAGPGVGAPGTARALAKLASLIGVFDPRTS